ncbi:MAG TPA: amidohydrolase [Woeseiaceae bacterium]|nr:amidohydrolase [Woeseiaceae bacterium]
MPWQRPTVPIAALLLCTLLAGACEQQAPASLVVTGARVWTGDAARPWAEALASRDERIVAVGSAAEIEQLIGDGTEVIRADGGLLVPGFIDSHVHFLTGGAGLASVQLREARSADEFRQRIAAFAAELNPGEWILNGNWDHENWGGELPRRDWIDAVTPHNPVWINRLDGHMALANSRALELAGVDADTPDVDGGDIVRDRDGRPSGVLKDNAMALVDAAVPPYSEAQLDRHAQAAMAYVAANGVTSVHDMADFRSLAAYRRARAAARLATRIYSVVPLPEWRALADDIAAHGRGDEWLRVGGVKGFMDGSLGSHTAAFLQPFSDAPGDRGLLVSDRDDMRRWIGAADDAGLQVMVHAIGDRAIRDLLDIYLDVADDHGARDRRFRIEHAQHIAPQDLPRFAAQQVIASMQPYHAIDDGRWADKVIGAERALTTYAFRSLIASGAHVAFGSDWFVAPPTPIDGIYAAVTRRTLDGAHPDGWVPSQKISVEQALAAYTSEAAYASFEEDVKGRLKAGMLADFVLLDRDLTRIPPQTIRDTRILRTVVGGRTVYRADAGRAGTP